MSELETRRDSDFRILQLLESLYVSAGGVPTEEDATLLELAAAETEKLLSIDARVERLPVELRGADLEERLRPVLGELKACGPLELDRLVGLIAQRWKIRVGAVRDMIDGAAEEDGGGEEAGEGRGSARGIIQGVVSDLGLVRDLRHVEYVVVASEAIPVGSSAFAKRISYLVRELHGMSVTASMISDAVLPLLGAELPVIEIPIRVAGDTSQVILDMADGTGRAIVITPDGAQLVETSPVAFLRPAGIAALPEPVFAESPAAAQAILDAYWLLMGYGDDESGKKTRAATFAWVMSALRRATNYVAALLVGDKGCGKTWRARMMRDAVDPYALDVESLPQDLEQLTVCAMGSHAMAFDNVSRVGFDISDGLCSLATGGGRRARKFYTESEAVLFKFSRPVILTSIVEAVTEGDLLDRAVIIRALKAKRRRGDEQLAQEFSDLHPALLGALCYFVSVALKNLAGVTVPDDVRMQSAAAFAAAAEEAAGFQPGAVFGAYRQAQDDARSIVAEQPVARTILDWTAEPSFGRTWSGTATELRTILTERLCGLDDRGRLLKREPKGWPADSRGLSSALRRVAPTLAEMGIDIEFGSEGSGKARHRTVVVTKRDADASTVRDAEAAAPWDADAVLISIMESVGGTHGTLGTQESPPSTGAAQKGGLEVGGVDALSFFPQEKKASVPCVPCVPHKEMIDEKCERKIQVSVPCVPPLSVSSVSPPANDQTDFDDLATPVPVAPPALVMVTPTALSAPLRARVTSARLDRTHAWHPDDSYPGGLKLVVWVETEVGPAVYEMPLHPLHPFKTIEHVRAFGGVLRPNGSWLLRNVELSVQVAGCASWVLPGAPSIPVVVVAGVIRSDGAADPPLVVPSPVDRLIEPYFVLERERAFFGAAAARERAHPR